MATTIPGGKYLGEDGETFHDANGKVISGPWAVDGEPLSDSTQPTNDPPSDSTQPANEPSAQLDASPVDDSVRKSKVKPK
jgi:hypothetical protein